MESKKLSQKEYLKKYLSGGDKKKKIKKKKIKNSTVQIIDDDINLDNIRPMDDAEFDIINATEDAPMIVGVIDERGPVDFADRKKWKIIADDGEGNVTVNSTQNNIDNNNLNKLLSYSESEFNSKNERRLHKSKRYSPDRSPPRISEKRKNSSKSSQRVSSDSDLSPPRASKKSSDKKHKHQNSRYNSDVDLSPPRKSKHHSRESRKTRRDSDSDLSPPRKSKNHSRESRRGSDSDLSPPRKSKHSRESSKSHNGRKRSRWASNSDRSPSPETNGRLKKTLDGKTAGLQNADALREETEAHRQREKEMFNSLSAEVSGFGQAAVMRDRRTGKRRDLAAEELERLEKEKRQKEIDDKYAKWGRGLKQVDDRAEKLKQDLYEMSKPLARYADDADLDAHLRSIQHEFEDPLRQFAKDKKPKPIYQNASMPNRFGIKPGHRWDGVDRSNGYEKKWFEAKNARAAIQEEAYKWSTSDM
ncbi:hypothetical protein G9C98_003337 [Cotesia typhae]|uniref:BUD13 homolog n=1 Tax=Cotesia typhae TaxID=2053667 RepID=A0A8J5UV96_9HYME|nr:hypothetical protein G9C98_003337 [Cotesia typhae]